MVQEKEKSLVSRGRRGPCTGTLDAVKKRFLELPEVPPHASQIKSEHACSDKLYRLSFSMLDQRIADVAVALRNSSAGFLRNIWKSCT